MNKDKIILLTVTYNSSIFLERLVKSVAVQTYEIYKLIVVDNASSKEHADKIQKLANDYPFIEIVKLENNLGGAGGFQLGTEYILLNYSNCDWIWYMDDDAFPQADCLEKLLKYKNLENLGCLTPVIFGINLEKFQTYHHKTESKFLNKDIIVTASIDKLNEFNIIEANAFVGPLIRLNVVKSVGVPDGSLFIYGDDVEYIYRISRKYKVYLIKDAVINHRDTIPNKDGYDTAEIWKSYYKYRNRFLFIEKYKKNYISGLIGKTLVVKDIIRDCLFVIKRKKYKGYRLLKIKFLVFSLKDGLLAKKGKTYDPLEFNKLLDK